MAYSLRASGPCALLPSQRSRFPHGFPSGCKVTIPSRMPIFEIPTRNTNRYRESKRVPRSSLKNKRTIMRACRAACRGFQLALILAFRFIITRYHSKACRYLQSSQARSHRLSKPDSGPQSDPGCGQKRPGRPLADTD